MSEKKDTFWKLFLLSTTFVLVVLCAAALVVVSQQGYFSFTTARYDPTTDPFAYAAPLVPMATSSVFYRESLPLGYSSASWNSQVNWSSSAHYYGGMHAIEAHFLIPNAGVGMIGPGVFASGYKAFELAVFAEPGISDLYLELYDKRGRTIGLQSLGWYMPNKTFVTGSWQVVDVPLSNFATSTPLPAIIGGFGITSKEKGTVYIDSVRLTAASTTQEPPWAQPKDTGAATLLSLMSEATTTMLPYQIAFTKDDIRAWYPVTGVFSFFKDYVAVAPPAEGGDSMAILLGTRGWRDYHVDAALNWGDVGSFSLLVRIVNDGDLVSCAFSQYATGVQIYRMKDGLSHLMGETPPLPVADANPWDHVHVGATAQGNKVTCYANGDPVLSAIIPGLSPDGAVGVETWDPAPLRQPHHLLSFTAQPL